MATEEQLKQALIKAHNAGDTRAAQVIADRIKAQRGQLEQPQTAGETQQIPEGNVINQIVEPVEQLARGIGGTVAGGLAGLGNLIASGDIDSAVNRVKEVQQQFASDPETQQGQRGAQILNNTLQQLEGLYNTAAGGAAGLASMALNPSGGLDRAREQVQAVQGQGLGGALGQDVLNRTGSPLLATGAELIPSVGELASGRLIGKSLSGDVPPPIRTAEDALVETGRQQNVPILTSDAFPPQGAIGKHLQRFSEKLGPLGSGAARQAQQISRQRAVEDLAAEYGVELDSPFMDEVVSSMTSKNARKLELGNMQRRKAIETLKQYGEVPTDKIITNINQQLERQQRLGEKADQSLIKNLNAIKNSVQGKDFDDLASVRTEVINDIKALERSEDRRALAATSSVKQSIDEQLRDFAVNNDRDAAVNWLRANRNLADQLGEVSRSELKRLIDKGDVTPEVVAPILRGGKRSQLQRLNRSLTPKGRASARAAVVRDVLDKSGFFRGDINPNRLATELNKTNTQQAIDVLFTDQDKAQLSGLTRLLDATRRAQDAPVTLETGGQLFLPAAGAGVGAGLTQSPILTMATVGSLSALAKSYESKPFRNLLLRLNRTKKGSKQEKRILESAIPGVIAGLQAAREEQQIDTVSQR